MEWTPQRTEQRQVGSLRRVCVVFAALMGAITVVLFYLIARIYKERAIEHTVGAGAPWVPTAALVVGALLAGFAILLVILFRSSRDPEELAGRLLSLMNNVPGLVYRGLPDWSLAFLGGESERITGYTTEELTSGAVRWPDLIHPDDLGAVTQTMREAVTEGKEFVRLEYRATQKDGSHRWLADRRQLIYGANGKLVYIDGLLLDITARKHSEEMLRLTQFAVDRAGDAAYWMGPDGRLLYANDQACRNLGYSREELLCRKVHDINPSYSPESWDAHWEDLRRRKSYTVETRHRTKDGRLIPVEVSVNFLEFDGKEYNCVSARDITERAQAREESRLLQAQLLQSQKMEAIGSLAGGIAHDFNNLLTGILGYANLLKFKAAPGGEVYKASQVILDAAERASHLTSQLLGFARKGKNLAVPVDIHRTIDAVTSLLDRALDKRIRINKVFTLQGATVVGDPTQIQQVLMNLAVNARDAMPDGGELFISTEIVALDEAYCRTRPGSSPGRHVRVVLRDTGVGIPPENLERIFDPFFTTKGHGQGTGLGLSMVFGIVKNHGGHVEVESEVGAGTTFRLYLPAVAVTAGAEGAEASGEVELGSKRGRILLIDDQETVRDVCSAMLQNLGYAVNTARDGVEGLEYYRRHGRDIDLVIIDMVMPNMGGRDCFREIKAINPDVRAILSTGFSLDGAVQEIIDEGIAAFLQKPYRMEQLSRVVSGAIGRTG